MNYINDIVRLGSTLALGFIAAYFIGGVIILILSLLGF